jgi:hypothetical protein
MSQVTVEMVFWPFAIVVFGIAALMPQHFIRFLGAGKVTPSPNTLLVFPLIDGFCVIGLIYTSACSPPA